jgi:hypothetical protein
MGGGSQFTMTLCTGLSQTPENQNGGRPHPCRMEAGAGSDEPTMTEHGIYVPGHPFAIFIQVSNRGRNGCIKSWFCQYISIPMKYTVNGSTLQCIHSFITVQSNRGRNTRSLLNCFSWGHLGHIIRYAFERTGTECHGILRYGKIYEFLCLFVCFSSLISRGLVQIVLPALPEPVPAVFCRIRAGTLILILRTRENRTMYYCTSE